MANVIEVAKSGRATCRACREAIAKGELRFGAEAPNSFGDAPSYLWHHLKCGATKHPDELRDALSTYVGEVPDREEIDRLLADAESKKPPPFPHADRAPTGRAKCQVCGEAITKGALRVAFEREIERGMTVTKGAGYLHAGCATAHAEANGSNHEELTAKLRENTRGLSEADLDELFAVV